MSREAFTHKLVALLRGHSAQVNVVIWAPQNAQLASASHDATIRLWSTRGHQLALYRGHAWSVNALAWSPDGRYMASGSDDMMVHIWDLSTEMPISTYLGHAGSLTNFVEAVAWSPHGSLIASGSDDGQVHVWTAS